MSRFSKWPERRSTVVPSKRSRLYSQEPVRPETVWARLNVRSNLAVTPSAGSEVRVSPGSTRAPPGAFWRTNITAKSGVRPRCRSGSSTSTTFSNGRSWWAKAWSAVERTRPSSSRKVGWPAASTRSTRVLTKKPISPSTSRRLRLAMGEPTARSSLPVERARRAAKPARSCMKRVAPAERAARARASERLAGERERADAAPRRRHKAGADGRSADRAAGARRALPASRRAPAPGPPPRATAVARRRSRHIEPAAPPGGTGVRWRKPRTEPPSPAPGRPSTNRPRRCDGG